MVGDSRGRLGSEHETRPLYPTPAGSRPVCKQCTSGMSVCSTKEPSSQRRMLKLPLLPPPGELSFDDVCFHYEPGHPVLRHVSWRVPGGNTIAFVGATGSGKSTITRLIFRSVGAAACEAVLACGFGGKRQGQGDREAAVRRAVCAALKRTCTGSQPHNPISGM